jgi:hypothetical protein
MLKPLLDLDNAAVMMKLGRLSALRNARADAMHVLRDSCVRLQNAASADVVEFEIIEAALARLKEINFLQAQIT